MMNKSIFTQREISEIELALFYAMKCKHITAGHNRLLLIAKMAQNLGFGMGSNAKMIVPSDVLVEAYDLGPATAKIESAKEDEGYL